MSLKEADRYAVIVQVIERTMGQSDAARWLNISVRQVKRLVRAIRQDAVLVYERKPPGANYFFGNRLRGQRKRNSSRFTGGTRLKRWERIGCLAASNRIGAKAGASRRRLRRVSHVGAPRLAQGGT